MGRFARFVEMSLVTILLAAPAARATKDAGLYDIYGIAQLARDGTYPDGQSAISLSTQVCNLGDENIPWRAPMLEDHPFIAYSVYRVLDDRLEQIGRSWVKHTFYASSESLCAACSDPGGLYLPVNCADTYGNSSNGSQFYLGPREEIDPHAATWTACGSYFDGTPVDCQRDNPTGLGVLDHRCVLNDSDLDNAGASYYYEAFYLVRGDVDPSNNIGSRRCTMTWNGTKWVFATPVSGNATLLGPAIATRWLAGGPNEVLATVADPGLLYVASKATDLGAGQFHYEYAVFNYTYTRRMRSFVVPLPSAAQVSNIGFHDGDADAGNDWPATVDPTCQTITWQTATYAQNPQANALIWGGLFNFRLDADVAPTAGTVNLDPFLSGGGSDPLTANAVVPSPVGCTPGDANGDGRIDGLDIEPFVTALLTPPCAGSQAFCIANVHNSDPVLDAQDAFDLVALLLSSL